MFGINKMIFYKRSYGNTLAETLIAMTIVGIVFTISVGVMFADYNRNQTVVRLKKMYSIVSQAFDRAIANEGPVNTWGIADNTSEKGSADFFDTYLKPYFMIAKDCKDTSDDTCKYDFKELDGTPKELNSTWKRFFLNDGAFVAMQTFGNDNYKVVYFYVDTNGKKRLNVVARDIFLMEFWLQNDSHPAYTGRLRMYGEGNTRAQLMSTDNVNACHRTRNGNYCGALIKNDGWQIKDGYPWAQARYIVQ